MRRRWKLGTRVALAASLAMLIGVVGLEVSAQVILKRELHQELDNILRQRAADVDELAETRPKALTSKLEGDPRSIGTDIEVIDSNGQRIGTSRAGEPPLAPPALIQSVLVSRTPQFASTTFGGRSLRVYLHPLEPGTGKGNGGVVVVAASTDAVDDGLARVRLLTLVAGLVAIAVAAAACLAMTRRALRPLTTLNRDVMEVQRTADPSRRITAEPTGDEVEQLAGALNAMLAALQRAREIEQRFVADASHEMRTPLTALRGNAAYLAQHGADAEAFADLENDMARLAQLLDRLLTLAREDAAPTPTEEISVASVIDRFSSDPQVTVGSANGLVVRGDTDAIARAVTNLVENAKLYGPPDGPITVTAARDGEEVVLTVTDSGAGISTEDADLATTRFWRGSNSTGINGAGLGLGLVQATAERHGGTLTINGSAFAIRLPAT